MNLGDSMVSSPKRSVKASCGSANAPSPGDVDRGARADRRRRRRDMAALAPSDKVDILVIDLFRAFHSKSHGVRLIQPPCLLVMF